MAYPAGINGIGATTYSCYKTLECMKTLKIPQIVIVPLWVPLLGLNAFFFALEAGQILANCMEPSNGISGRYFVAR
jgi:hypothetical protein